MQRDTGFMDWVDRVREQANAMAQKAQDTQLADQDQWEEIHTSRQISSLMHDLGELVYRQETRGETADTRRAIAKLVQEIKQLEDALVTVDLRDSSRQPV